MLVSALDFIAKSELTKKLFKLQLKELGYVVNMKECGDKKVGKLKIYNFGNDNTIIASIEKEDGLKVIKNNFENEDWGQLTPYKNKNDYVSIEFEILKVDKPIKLELKTIWHGKIILLLNVQEDKYRYSISAGNLLATTTTQLFKPLFKKDVLIKKEGNIQR